ncbi:hypothetical protein BJ508DRAFT_29519 [Ascobolus immersus RN42]|uniref:Uncharacterized protein n=1 Tax=Ascobolus immersus RN42 TaxID=1160509 RepID=A0A3N4HSS2_ASCIM|nr:hypothetical protein BJ508DRAFT_29519 [Ascobolus immersus RN42]
MHIFYESNHSILPEVFQWLLEMRLGGDAEVLEVRKCGLGKTTGFCYRARKALTREVVKEMEEKSSTWQLEQMIAEAIDNSIQEEVVTKPMPIPQATPTAMHSSFIINTGLLTPPSSQVANGDDPSDTRAALDKQDPRITTPPASFTAHAGLSPTLDEEIDAVIVDMETDPINLHRWYAMRIANDAGCYLTSNSSTVPRSFMRDPETFMMEIGHLD